MSFIKYILWLDDGLSHDYNKQQGYLILPMCLDDVSQLLVLIFHIPVDHTVWLECNSLIYIIISQII